jgi:archaemetzincin
MKKRRIHSITLVIFVLLFSIHASGEWKQPIALQSFGKIDQNLIEKVVKGINDVFCKVEINVQPAIPLPKYAYYQPRKRYRAEKLLRYLRSYYDNKVKKKYAKVIGLTYKDISTTKGQHKDWGIFGMAFLNTGPCVVSTYRLKRGAKSQKHFMERLIKVIIHELGHAYGLDHCTTKSCVMQDARGTIKTVDNNSGHFCSRCREKLFRILCKAEKHK